MAYQVNSTYYLLLNLSAQLPDNLKHPIIFEIISHRYTLRAKGRIEQIFPETSLPMTGKDRQFKYGQFGYGKYVYPKEQIAEIKDFFKKSLDELFPYKDLKYII